MQPKEIPLIKVCMLNNLVHAAECVLMKAKSNHGHLELLVFFFSLHSRFELAQCHTPISEPAGDKLDYFFM